MTGFFARRLVAAVTTLACIADGAAWVRSAGTSVRTEDRNGDGRPDVWRFYDGRGELVRVLTDTNFDGRSDQDERYVGDALVSREVDRNFDQRIDAIEEFDPVTHQSTRTLIDVDFDGTADVLVLFQDGRPVFSKWADTTPPSARVRSIRSAFSLRDPFYLDPTIRQRAEGVSFAETIGVLPTVDVPRKRIRSIRPPLISVPLDARSIPFVRRDAATSDRLRGPPCLLLL